MERTQERDTVIIEDVMTHDPVTVPETARVAEAIERMAVLHVRHLPVVRDGRLVGVLSDRDLRGAEPQGRVADVMTCEVLTTTPREPVEVAAARMAWHKVSSLLVVQDDARPVGIVTTYDLLDALAMCLRRRTVLIAQRPRARLLTR